MRNAEKDREIIAETKGLLDIYGAFIETSDYMLLVELQDHWLERAVAAEQRVAELEKVLEEIKNEEWRLAGEFTTIYMAAYSAIYHNAEPSDSLESEDRGE